MKTVHRLPGVSVLLCLLVIGHCFGQTTPKVRERINTIISETIKRGEFTTPNGVTGLMRTPPLPQDVEEITRYGDRAVEPLEEYFSSANAFEYELAMRVLAGLGGKRIIEPLKKVILYDRSARKREYALRWISQGPWDEAAKVISQAADNDPDANVRKVAQGLLSGY
jgi:hypothetical protein